MKHENKTIITFIIIVSILMSEIYILSSFYNFHKQIFDIFKDLPEKINQEILIPLKKTKKIFEKENKKTIMSIKDVIEQLSLHQDVLNIIKKRI